MRDIEENTMTQTDPNTATPETYDLIEELQLAGEQLLGKVKSLIREGSVRHIRIKQEGRVILEVPLALGFAGVVFAPTLAAIGAMGALLAQCSIEVVRAERASAPEEPAPASEEPSQDE
jgi:hypothetical protein